MFVLLHPTDLRVNRRYWFTTTWNFEAIIPSLPCKNSSCCESHMIFTSDQSLPTPGSTNYQLPSHYLSKLIEFTKTSHSHAHTRQVLVPAETYSQLFLEYQHSNLTGPYDPLLLSNLSLPLQSWFSCLFGKDFIIIDTLLSYQYLQLPG